MALTEERVAAMIAGSTANLETHWNEKFGSFLVQGQDQGAIVQGVVVTRQEEMVNSQKRISDIVDGFNASCAELERLTRLASSQTSDLDSRLKKLMDDMNNFAAENQAAMTQMQAPGVIVKDDALKEFADLRGNLETWANGLKQELADKMAGTGGAVPNDGRRLMGATNVNGIHKKEVTVWKRPEVFDKSGFRHWIQAFDLQLEEIHKFKYAEQALGQIKRSKVEITPQVLNSCVATLNLATEGVNGSLGADDTTDSE